MKKREYKQCLSSALITVASLSEELNALNSVLNGLDNTVDAQKDKIGRLEADLEKAGGFGENFKMKQAYTGLKMENERIQNYLTESKTQLELREIQAEDYALEIKGLRMEIDDLRNGRA